MLTKKQTVQTAINMLTNIEKLLHQIEEFKKDPNYVYVMSEPEVKDLLEKIKTRATEEEKEVRLLEIMS